jgi:predicted membrane chloride channel (bestrophin family)
VQRQYKLLTAEHNELLRRMEVFMKQPVATGNSGESTDHLKIKLAAAHCLIEDLRRACTQQEGTAEVLAKVCGHMLSSAATALRIMQMRSHQHLILTGTRSMQG